MSELDIQIESSINFKDQAPDIFEKLIIGCILTLDPKSIGKLAGQISPELFATPRNRFVYAILRRSSLSKAPLRLQAAAATLESSPGFLEHFKGFDSVELFLEDCVEIADPPESWQHHAKSLKLAYSRRKLMDAFDDASVGALSADTADDAASTAIGRVVAVAGDLRKVSLDTSSDLDTITQEFLEEYESEPSVTPFPQHQLNTAGGFRPGNVIILSGYTGSRKSFTALDWMIHASEKHGKRCRMYSLEVSKSETIERMLAMKCGYKLDDVIQRSIPIDEINKSLEELSNLDISIIDKSITADRIISDIVALGDDRPDIVVVDHIHLLNFKKDDYLHSLNSTLTQFKALAQDYGVTMILVAQLARPSEKGKDLPPPNMYMLKFSGAIEQIADYIIFVHRMVDNESYYPHSYYCMWTEKQRQGKPADRFNVELKNMAFR